MSPVTGTDPVPGLLALPLQSHTFPPVFQKSIVAQTKVKSNIPALALAKIAQLGSTRLSKRSTGVEQEFTEFSEFRETDKSLKQELGSI